MPGKSKQCPSCWLLVGPFETKCPRCGTALGEHPTVMEPEHVSNNVRQPNVQCDNCGATLPPEAGICPTCGKDISPPQNMASGIWPPGPKGQIVLAPDPIPLCTGSVAGDIALGVITSFAGVILAFITLSIALVAVIIVYFSARKNYPVYIRGMNYGFTAAVFMLMTPCLLCIAGPSLPWLHKLLPWTAPFSP